MNIYKKNFKSLLGQILFIIKINKLKQILILISVIFFSSYAHSQDFNGLWKVVANVFDGTTEQYDNLYFNVKDDSIEFLKAGSVVGAGKISNDTIFVEKGFTTETFDSIYRITDDSLISSRTNSRHVDDISFTRVDLSGDWEQADYSWDDKIIKDTCEIIQKKDSIYFYKSSDCFAIGHLEKDSIIVDKGFEGVGVSFFTMNSNDSFVSGLPMAESLDKVLFSRLDLLVDIEISQENFFKNSSIKILPSLSGDYLSIASQERQTLNIKLYSLLGEILINQNIDTQSVDLDISYLNKGMYVLEVKSSDNKVINHRILKK